MTVDLTIMFDLSFHRLGGEWIGRFRDTLQPGDNPGKANSQHLSVKSSPKESEGQTRHYAIFPSS